MYNILLSFFIIFQDARESDSDKDVEDSAGEKDRNMQKDTNAEAKVPSTDRTVYTPTAMQRELVPRQHHGISGSSEGAGCCKPQDSERDQLNKLSSGFAHSWFYPLELNRKLWDPSHFYPSQVNDWYSGATVDTAVQSGLSLAAHAKNPGPAGFSVGHHQHTLVQVRRGLTKKKLKCYYRFH